ncbi:putative sugar nucleotidyl transferase [Paraflavitalea speifideaquila]|uniref:putative sugar nucleotidyl transferase n=1 Tax=Paraflavitalea speifideaquila TaxID=3076558 RepID=UPI0028F16A3F|nr:putative sugar nucleotidyl transferase [Paraflavitalea speifideiaquila]
MGGAAGAGGKSGGRRQYGVFTEGGPFASNIIPSEQFIASLQKEDNTLKKDPDWESIKILQYPWHIFEWNDWALREDFKLLTRGKTSQVIPQSVQAINPQAVFIEEGARLAHCMLNASLGPIYIGKDAEIMEGSFIRGPFALCEGAVVKMGSKIYGATTIGPKCTVGGEIKNSVFFGYSNKAHDGYLGDAVIGEWCNLGQAVPIPTSKTMLPMLKYGIIPPKTLSGPA